MGPLTQEDPIGIAGGLNLYGYANGDPINFSDPFGLCPEEEKGAICRWLVEELRKLEGDEFQKAAAAYDESDIPVELGIAGEHPALRNDAYGVGLGQVVKNVACEGGQCALRDEKVVLNMQQAVGDFFITAVHESYHLNLRGNLTNTQISPFEKAALISLPATLRRLAPHYGKIHGIR